MYKAALFDLDGVIFDTEPQYTAFWDEQSRYYFPDKKDLAHIIKGRTLTEIFDTFFKGKEEEQKRIVQAVDDLERKMSFDYVPGFQDFLQDLKTHGMLTAVVTSSNHSKMDNVYRSHPEFKGMFDAILTAEDFRKGKPDPDCYLRAAKRLGVQPVACVGFEDSFNGLKSVKAAHMKVVGLSTTNSEESIKSYCDICIPNYIGQDISLLKEIM